MKVDESNRQLYSALGRIASGLFIVTMKRDGVETGMLASWVQQCSFAPPLVTLAVAKERYLTEWMTEGAEFTLNILDDTQTDMIAHFGKGFAPDEDAFEGLMVERSGNSAPILTESLGYLVCRVSSTVAPGDHILVIAEVVLGMILNEGQPMVHVRKSGAHY